MANRKKAKTEEPKKVETENVTSNIEEIKEEKLALAEIPEDIKEEIAVAENIAAKEETIMTQKSEENKPKLKVLADDRLNSLINRANELGITDVVQVINSDKFGQFYLVYKE